MAFFKCKMCGGDLEVNQEMKVCECQYCGSMQTLPKLSDEKKNNLYDRAGHFRRNNEYDKAMSIYEQILNEDTEDAESYWSIVLCKYGIEYVEDPATHKRVPTVNRAQMTSVFTDENYKSALKYADSEQRAVYEAEAREIEQIQKGILEISSKEEPFDVFICYKESDASGRRTPDSVLANDLYHQLTQEGFKVFFARITLEDKLGSAYEPYIFAALNSAKVMVVLGTKPEYFNAVWVKNEWSRFLAQIKAGANKVLIPAYKDMDPYDLPEEFSHLQAQDMTKLGFMQDLIRGIKKIAGTEKKEEPKPAPEVNYVQNGNANALIERAFLYLEDGEFAKADELCEQALNQDPKNAKAYVGKLMVSRKVKTQDALAKQKDVLTEDNYFQKAIRFAEDGLKKELERCNSMIMDSGYEEILRQVQTDGVNGGIKAAIGKLNSAIAHYEGLLGWENKETKLSVLNDQKTKLMQKLYEDTRKQVLNNSDKKMDAGVAVKALKAASKSFELLGEYEDSVTLLQDCRAKLSIFEKKLRKARNRKIRMGVVAVLGMALIVLAVIFVPRILKDMKYEKAFQSMQEGKYEKAQELYEELGEREKVKQCMQEQALKYMEEEQYEEAMELFEQLEDREGINNCIYKQAINFAKAEQYEEAISMLNELDAGYKGVDDYIADCGPGVVYTMAMGYKEKWEYDNAIALFQKIENYKDSGKQVSECKKFSYTEVIYQRALSEKKEEKYEQALETFKTISEYRDSKEQAEECKGIINEEIYQRAIGEKKEKKYEQAMESFLSIRGYKDSKNQIEECTEGIYQTALEYKNKKDYWSAMKAFERISAYKDSAGQREVLCEDLRISLRECKTPVATNNHTVGLKKDGTVVAVGRNFEGQRNVTDWTDIVAISAGEYHTVGLKKDGTVVAVGSNGGGQCNVTDWTDIVAISAGDDHTVGLKADGTVVAVGRNFEGQRNVTDWTDIVAISAGRYHTVGLKKDGTVVAVGDNGGGQCNVTDWTDIVAISAGYDHTVGLKADGTVVAVGRNKYGECNVTVWVLKVPER